AAQDARPAPRGPARRGGADHCTRTWAGSTSTSPYASRLEGAGITQSMSRKGNCIDNAATEQLFGHVKDEFYRGREWGSFGDFKRDLEEYIDHWNTRRRQVRLKGLTPEEFRNRALAA
ncbi:IS3 family transposase, partial [Collinsella sp. 4_8_47FAA]|uniref:IS3 family transposase n=1 Tax=Collinsella sp. 4_8_47FAA TaxID=742722 RepID=UPI00050EDEA9